MRVQFSLIASDDKGNEWWAVGTRRGWFEFRVTPSGYIRLDETIHYKEHPYFTIKKGD